MRQSFWNLNKLIVLSVLGGLFGLLLELRYMHREVLVDHPLSWTPLVYSGLMLLVGLAALGLWDKGGRKALFWCFAIGLVVGPLGLWLHTDKHPLRGIEHELSAWTMPLESEHAEHKGGGASDQRNTGEAGEEKRGDEGEQKRGEAGEEKGGGKPPVMAPLSFLGLGVLGMLACAGRFQPKDE